jgi:hypothetical protein
MGRLASGVLAGVLLLGCGNTEESEGTQLMDGAVASDMAAPSDAALGNDSAPGPEMDAGADASPTPMVDATSPSVDATPVDGGAPATELGTLLFASGFEPDTLLQNETPQFDRLLGLDRSVPAKGDWAVDLVGENPFVSSAVINYEDDEGDREKRRAELITEGGNTYLRYQMNRAHIEIVSPHDPEQIERKGRIQLGLRNLMGYRAFGYRVKIRLGGGLIALSNANQAITWLTLSEFWNDVSSSMVSSRIHIGLHKGAGERGLHWSVEGEEKVYRDNGTSTYETVEGLHFPDAGAGFPAVPAEFDQWLVLTVRAREGLGDDGRLVVTVGRVGEEPTVVADYRGQTVHSGQLPEELDGFDSLQPLKLYTNGLYLEALHEMGAPGLVVDWDDFELYEGFVE